MAQRFAQISDPHLSSLEGVRASELLNKRLLGYLSWRRRRRFEHRSEVLDALLADLAESQLDQLLVSGDLTHVGLPSEFLQARRWLERLGNPRDVALIPGNHDACVHAPWEDTFAHWLEYMASDQAGDSPSQLYPSYRERGAIAFIGLSSACPTPPLMASGKIDDRQLEKLPSLLESARAAGRFRVVYVHHSPLPGAEKWRKRLRNAPALAALLSAHGAELVLHGHGHRAREHWLESRDGSIPVISVPSASALGLHGGEVAAYNTYLVEPAPAGWHLDVMSRRYDGDSGRFAPGDEKSLVLDRARPGAPD
jgi:3',5'-cyclic AMP phosphodiesterase CpdA